MTGQWSNSTSIELKFSGFAKLSSFRVYNLLSLVFTGDFLFVDQGRLVMNYFLSPLAATAAHVTAGVLVVAEHLP